MENTLAFNSKTEGEGIKKLSPNETIALLVHNINLDSKDGFYRTAEQYQKALSPNGDFSWRLKRLLNEKPKHFTQLSELSSDIKKLIVQKDVGDECVYLNSTIQSFINQLLIEWKNAEVFRYHNLGVRNKILLHGPTGNGKTTLARHIARLTELPFIEVNADLIIDSHIGSSGANIHKIFNQIKMPCVLFWDEVDTIGRARGKGNDSAAGMENERMVNSVLVNIEKLNNDVIFIGATNRREVLDTAFLRRFDCQLELGEPSDLEKETFASKLIEWFKLPIDNYNSNRFNNFSEIKLDLIDLTRKYVLSEIQTRAGVLELNALSLNELQSTEL